MTAPTRKFNPGFLNNEELVASYCVRMTEFELLVEVLRECTGCSNPHQIVIGPRGSGKTSLLLRVAAEVDRDAALASRFFPVVFAEESYEVATAGEFWLECLTNLATQATRREDAPDLHRTVDELRAIRDDQALSDRCLGALLDFADREDKRLVLLVENLNMLFGDMADPDAAGWRLRKILQTEPRIIVFASATSRFDEIDNPDRALYDLFRVRTLRSLDRNQCAVLWETVSGRSPAPETIRPLEILTGGSPRLISIVARFGAGLSFRKLMADLLDLVDDHTEYFKSHLESLPAQERRVYLALATLWKPATTREIADHARLETSTCSAQLARLVERGVVRVAGGSARRKQYYLTERLYNIYYLLRRRRGPDRLVKALIHFMASYYSPPELKDISARMVHDAAGHGTEMRSLHRIALAGLVELSSLAEYRDELLAMMPAGFVAVSGRGSVPEDVAQTTAAGMRVDDDRAERSQGSPGESAERAARELFKTTVALNVLNRAEDTVEACDEVIRRFGESEIPAVLVWVAKALANKGTTLSELNRPQDALEAYGEVIRRFGRSETPALLDSVATALVNRGAVLGALNRPQDALEASDEVIRRFGKSETPAILERVATALGNRGAALVALNCPQDALEACDEVIRRFGKSETPAILERVATALGNRGAALVALNCPQDALEACDEVIRRFGKSETPALLERVAAALVNRGPVLGALNRPQDALEASDEVIRRFGESETPALLDSVAAALGNRGAVLGALNRPQDALEASDEVIRRFGKSETPALLERVASALVNRGAVLSALNRPQDALEACDEVIRRFGESKTQAILDRVATALGNKGAVLVALNRPQDALEACDEVIRRFGESETPALLERVASALGNRGAVLSALNRPQDALEVCDEVVRRFGESKTQAILDRVATALGNKGAVLVALNRPQDALEACDEVIRRFGESDSSVFSVEVKGALLWRADIELKTRQYEKAVETAGRVINGRHRGSPEQQLRGHVIRAKAFFAGGDRSAGEHAVEAVLALLPELGSTSREAIVALIGFSVDLGLQRMRELIQTSPSAHLLLPLTTALERELGYEPRVAREVDEVAQDIQQTLKANLTDMKALPNLELKKLATTPGPRQHLAFDELARRIRDNPSSWSPEEGPWAWDPLDITRAPNAIEAEWAFLKWSQRLNDGKNPELEQEQEARLRELESHIDQNPDSLGDKYFNEIGEELRRQKASPVLETEF